MVAAMTTDIIHANPIEFLTDLCIQFVGINLATFLTFTMHKRYNIEVWRYKESLNVQPIWYQPHSASARLIRDSAAKMQKTLPVENGNV